MHTFREMSPAVVIVGAALLLGAGREAGAVALAPAAAPAAMREAAPATLPFAGPALRRARSAACRRQASEHEFGFFARLRFLRACQRRRGP